MSGVVLTGSSGALGRRVAAGFAASPSFTTVTGLDVVVPGGHDAGIVERRVDLLVDDLVEHLAEAETLVHLASAFGSVVGADGEGLDVALTRRVLDAAAASGISRIVLVGSAMVYGAWPDNPIPLTEDAPVRPNPGFGFAQAKARVEELAEQFRTENPEAHVAVLRPTTTLAEDASSWVSAALLSAAGVRAGEVDPPVQFLHFDDLASAVVLVAERGCDGVYNVAPDGWIPPDDMKALAGIPRPRVSVRLADRLVAARWLLGLSTTPPQVLPWIIHPWVVANDRLRGLGWEPSHTSEEAYVAGTAPGPLDTLSPKRRQELAIGAAVAAAVASGAVAVAIARRLGRRR